MSLGVLFGLLFTAVWFYILFAGGRSLLRKLGSFFGGGRGEASRATWTDQEYHHYAVAAALPEPTPANIDELTDDMEEALASEESLAKELREDMSEGAQSLAQLEKIAADWADRAALALSKGRNDLGRAAIVERLRTQDLIGDLKDKMAEDRQLLNGYEADIARLHERLSDTYRRQRHAYARIERAEHAARAQRLLGSDGEDHFAEELGRLERIADDVEGRAEAEGLGERRVERIGTIEHEARIDREIARLSRPPLSIDGDAARRTG